MSNNLVLTTSKGVTQKHCFTKFLHDKLDPELYIFLQQIKIVAITDLFR